MKKLIAVAVLALVAQAAGAATLLKFKDGSANVWDNIHVKGNQYCTTKGSGMEICADKSDVVLKKEVPADTDPMEYGGGAATDKTQSDNLWAAQYNAKAEAADKARKSSRDTEYINDHRKLKQADEDAQARKIENNMKNR